MSDGGKALIFIARAFTQETPLLVTDEPIASLGPASQIEIMKVFETLAHTRPCDIRFFARSGLRRATLQLAERLAAYMVASKKTAQRFLHCRPC